MSPAKVEALHRYPVKGLSAEALAHVDLEAGQTLPHDRIYAVEQGGPRFDQTLPAWLPKMAFLCLMKDAPLASLTASFDAETTTLTLSRDGEVVAEGDLESDEGRAVITAALGDYRGPGRSGELRVVRAPGHSFSDVPDKVVSIINLASVRAIEEVVGRSVDPLRFRGNLHVDGLPAWAENDWVGREIQGPRGVRLKVYKTTTRCAATEVDPARGIRDIDMMAVIRQMRGDLVCGVYAHVLSGGRLQLGDELMADG